MSQVCTRYAPSPTGIPHIGNIRTALFSFLFAKKQNGRFILRIEDTDQKRSTHEHITKIEQSLKSLNLDWDEKYLQSERLSIYDKYLKVLINKEAVYQDQGAWYFKVQTKDNRVSWQDLVHGNVSFPTKVIEDFVAVKSDGFPTYHFASVVDDHLMNISHVMRGDEWISSTPKHILLYQAFGWQHPQFAHLPPILGQDHKKLSKRQGAKSVLEYLGEGYLPEAIVNFLVLLGWSPKNNQEIFSLDELTREFSLDRINKNSPIFNIEKLNWFNGQWIRKLSDKELTKKINQSYPEFEPTHIIEVLSVTKDRLNKISDFGKIAAFFFQKPDLNKHLKDILVPKSIFEDIISALDKINSFTADEISIVVSEIMADKKLSKAQMYRSLGIAVSGELVTPPIFPSIEILGKKETIKRLKNVTAKIK